MWFLFYTQGLRKDDHEAECKIKDIGSTGFSFSATSTSKGGVFGNTSGTRVGSSSSLIGQKASTGFGVTGVEIFIA